MGDAAGEEFLRPRGRVGYARGMTLRLLAASLTIAPLALHAASSPSNADLAREYEQVRKIALRDAKVRAAFDDANARLDAKIIQLDPALENYVKHHGSPAPAQPANAAPTKPFRKSAPAPAPAPKTSKHTRTHVVARGDTLASIAKANGVSVAELKRANHIVDERKLAVGQVLTIPGGKAATSTSAPAPPPASAPKEKSWWDRLYDSTAR